MSDLPANGVEAVERVCGCPAFIRVPWCSYAPAEHEQQACGAKHPTNTSIIPCMIVGRPHSEHWSWSGCAGGHATWMDAAVAAAMQERRDGVGEGLVEQVTDAVVGVLEDRTYDRHAANESIWDETKDHLRLTVERILADRSARTPTLADEGLAGKVRALADEWEAQYNAPIDQGPGFKARPFYSYFAKELRSLLAPEEQR